MKVCNTTHKPPYTSLIRDVGETECTVWDTFAAETSGVMGGVSVGGVAVVVRVVEILRVIGFPRCNDSRGFPRAKMVADKFRRTLSRSSNLSIFVLFR